MRNFNTALGKASCGFENFKFIVREQVQVNPDNSQTMSVLTFLLFQIEDTAHRNTTIIILGKPDKMLILNLIHFKVDTN